MSPVRPVSPTSPAWSDSSVVAYIALGSNLGDRRGHLDAGLEQLGRSPGITVAAVSRFVETEPVGPPGQGPYLNAAARLRTSLVPADLLRAMLAVERDRGRDRSEGERWGPRTLDLDLLLYGDRILEEPGLEVPHPRMHERIFVLGPLAEVGPDAVHPVLGRTVRELLASVGPAATTTE